MEKESEKDKIDEEKEKHIKKKQEKQLKLILFVIFSVILIVIAVPLINNLFLKKFIYNGLEFEKAKFGKILFYTAKVPLTDISEKGKVISQEDVTSYLEVSFRNDPRKLEDININFMKDNKEIKFIRNNPVYITIQADSPKCEDNTIAVAGISSFLKGFGDLKIKGALDNKTYANESGFPYITCNDSGNFDTVLWIKSGNETIIRQAEKNCYELIYKDCEINRVSEKFILSVLETYMRYFNGNPEGVAVLDETNKSNNF